MKTSTLNVNLEKRRVEKVIFDFDNPGQVEVTAPVLTCENTNEKFFLHEDADYVLDKLQEGYDKAHKLLKNSSSD